MIKYLDAFPGILIYLISYTCASWILFKLLLEDIFDKKEINKIAFMPFCLLMLIGIWPLYKDVLFWLTGGAYMLLLLQGIFLIVFMEKYFRFQGTISKIKKSGLFILVFILGLNTQNLMLPVLFISLARAYQIYLSNSKRIVEWLLVITLPIIFSMIFTSFAPGNFLRLHKEQTIIDLSPFTLFQNSITIYLRFFNYSKWVAFTGFIFGLSIPYFIENYSHNFKKHSKLYLKRFLFFFFLSFLSMLPFILAPNIARIRVYFIGMIFLYIAFLFLGLKFTGLNSIVKKYKFINLLTSSILLVGIFYMIFQIQLLIPFSKEVEKRKEFLESKRKTKEIISYKKLILPENLSLIRWADYKKYKDWDKTKEYYDLGGYIELE
ncbi:MAG: hypothetical protein ACOYLT_06950 [Flavobacterium sp.]|uniref:hypothetical protein n=1 Tax=Flavobacterium sp. TaxID=239 RepID=UPI003BE04EEB